MRERPSIVLVNYLNTLPFLAGLKALLTEETELVQAHPADCARTFFHGQVDYGLVPVGALLGRTDWRRVGEYGIGCKSDVATVCLFGQTPIEEWDTVLLDYQSRTSVLLARILLRDHWSLPAICRPATRGFEEQIMGRTGGLIIGDRAIRARDVYAYCYDLGAAWNEWTGLPFIFALWVSRHQQPVSFDQKLEEAFAFGLTRMNSIATEEQHRYPNFDLGHYYQKNIVYQMNDDLLKGWEQFGRLAVELDR
ncbi:MAG: menaquinone biosynthesis protein [Lewinellaceae bacterium]|nr:menaquinone biosynthesis protein [Saprospiraceae bacterium]MCB9311229.1 menaquinone biosynthesis protein [Lewinellaceae bacterium]HRW76170.1 menaquinone biosynthesis protein [Saprospiraceae bacterium]